MDAQVIVDFVTGFFDGSKITMENDDGTFVITGVTDRSLRQDGTITTNNLKVTRDNDDELVSVGIAGSTVLFANDKDVCFSIHNGCPDNDAIGYIDDKLTDNEVLSEFDLPGDVRGMLIAFMGIFDQSLPTSVTKISFAVSETRELDVAWKKALGNLLRIRGTCSDGPRQAATFLKGKNANQPLSSAEVRTYRDTVRGYFARNELPPVWRAQFFVDGNGNDITSKHDINAVFVFEDIFGAVLA